jgi:C4-dicarboxylate-specific signal transduction histidine kinase
VDSVHEKILVFADKTQLNRLFTNLLQNAMEACHNQEICVISLSEELLDNHILIRISDNGEGIPDQMQSKIFIPNFTTKSSGTGLGLAMSKTIVEQAKAGSGLKQQKMKERRFCELPVYDESLAVAVSCVARWNYTLRKYVSLWKQTFICS